jgi:lipoprotein NlpI
MRKGNFTDAINDFTEVIQIDPSAEAVRLRGGAYSAKGDFDKAFADWTRSIGIVNNAGAHWLLWNYILSGRTSKKGVPWAEMNRDLASGVRVARLNNQTWPFPMIELYLGNRSATEMISAGLTLNEQCEAQFYLGEWHLLHANRAAATAALRIAANTCPKDFFEYDGAVAELTRLKQEVGNQR